MTFAEVVIACAVILPLLMVTQKGTPAHEKSETVRRASKGLDVMLAVGLLAGLYVLYTHIGA